MAETDMSRDPTLSNIDDDAEVEPAAGPVDEAMQERIAEEKAEEQLNAEDTTILVLLVQGNVIAAACYSTGTGNITCVPDRIDDQDYSFASLLKRIFLVLFFYTVTRRP